MSDGIGNGKISDNIYMMERCDVGSMIWCNESQHYYYELEHVACRGCGYLHWIRNDIYNTKIYKVYFGLS